VDHYYAYYIERLAFHKKEISRLPWRNKLAYVQSVAVDVPRVNRMLRIQESYIKTLRTYEPKAYQGAVTLILNEKAYRYNPTLGWSSLVRGKIDVHIAQGDHDTYIREHVRAAAKQLRHCLENAMK
jgi:hypothetical protein